MASIYTPDGTITMEELAASDAAERIEDLIADFDDDELTNFWLDAFIHERRFERDIAAKELDSRDLVAGRTTREQLETIALFQNPELAR